MDSVDADDSIGYTDLFAQPGQTIGFDQLKAEEEQGLERALQDAEAAPQRCGIVCSRVPKPALPCVSSRKNGMITTSLCRSDTSAARARDRPRALGKAITAVTDSVSKLPQTNEDDYRDAIDAR
ncbi:hypothetical protein AR457_40635 [Streptomyces agglomeratus]|nr:hypothetical protein AR457_40635 [Streptomyces agglomeratus]OEJ37016.1 hypothetical protein BGK70_01285 [Streptomyces agglomeratus]